MIIKAKPGQTAELQGWQNSSGSLGHSASIQPSAYTQTYSTASKTVPDATASNPPAGGTGTTAGAYDTAAHRDEMKPSLSNNIADVFALKIVVNAIMDALQSIWIGRKPRRNNENQIQ